MGEMAPYVPGDHLNYGHMKVGYSVDGGEMETSHLDPRLPLLQHADLTDKVVLLRVDHNVVKKGTDLPRCLNVEVFEANQSGSVRMKLLITLRYSDDLVCAASRRNRVAITRSERVAHCWSDVWCDLFFLCVQEKSWTNTESMSHWRQCTTSSSEADGPSS